MTVPYRPPGIPDSVWYQMNQQYTPPPPPTQEENYMNQYFPQQPQYAYRPPAQTGAPSWFQSAINQALRDARLRAQQQQAAYQAQQQAYQAQAQYYGANPQANVPYGNYALEAVERQKAWSG